METQNKQAAEDFLKLVVAGKIDEAYEKYIDMSGTHHNSFTPAGMEALKEGMKGAGKAFPNIELAIQHVVGEGDLVAVHSHMTLEKGKTDFASLHLFRFKDGKVVELWDLSQEIKDDSPNTDGVF